MFKILNTTVASFTAALVAFAVIPTVYAITAIHNYSHSSQKETISNQNTDHISHYNKSL